MGFSLDPVRTAADREEFLRLPARLHAGRPWWVPPHLASERKMLDPARNPFYRNAEAQHFLLRRDGRAEGRISAILNRRHLEFHPHGEGFFGYFDTPDDPEAARMLLSAAEEWLRERGMRRVLGPANPSMNDPCGLLVEGFRRPPFILMTANPEYYAPRIEEQGYAKAQDLLAYFLPSIEVVRDKVGRVAAEVRERGRVEIRSVDLKRFEADLRIVMDIYNDAWSANWGFVPMTDEEIRFAAEDLRPILLPELAYIAEIEGVPVGFSLGLPDVNQALRKTGGRLFPFGWIYFLRPMLRKIPVFRIVALGVKRSHHHSGIGTLFYDRYIREALARGHLGAELSWVLESNDLMNRPLVQMGAKPYKRYRVYGKDL